MPLEEGCRDQGHGGAAAGAGGSRHRTRHQPLARYDALSLLLRAAEPRPQAVPPREVRQRVSNRDPCITSQETGTGTPRPSPCLPPPAAPGPCLPTAASQTSRLTPTGNLVCRPVPPRPFCSPSIPAYLSSQPARSLGNDFHRVLRYSEINIFPFTCFKSGASRFPEPLSPSFSTPVPHRPPSPLSCLSFRPESEPFKLSSCKRCFVPLSTKSKLDFPSIKTETGR